MINLFYQGISRLFDIIYLYVGCEAKKLWLLMRHGTRYPSERNFQALNSKIPMIKEAILNKCKAGQCLLTEEQLKYFVDWKFNVEINQAVLLAPEGKNELIQLAKRFQSRFPTLLPKQYTNDTYKVIYLYN